MLFYKTKDIADIVGVHPNTIRLYESIGFLMPPLRLDNGYRAFKDIHIEQCLLIKMTLKSEFVFGGLRSKARQIITCSAQFDFDRAIEIAKSYQIEIKKHLLEAQKAIEYVNQLRDNTNLNHVKTLSRSEAAQFLGITIDQMRNWELNGLVNVPKTPNGYRFYTEETLNKLLMIKTLKLAKYSLSAILRVMLALDTNHDINISVMIDTPKNADDFIYICDRLLSELQQTDDLFNYVIEQIHHIKNLC